MKKITTVALAALLTISVVACGDDDGGDAATNYGFVGTVDGTDAFISIGIGDQTDGEAVVYVCNGDEEIAAWFRDTPTDTGDFTLTNTWGETVTATLSGGTYRGEYTRADGSVHAFTTEAITGDGGVYRTGDDAAEQGLVAIWVIDNAGGERGAILFNGTFQSTSSFSTTFTWGATTFTVYPIVGMNGIIFPNN